MQTFLPYYSFTESLQSLDNKRLGKQRLEALQIISIIEGRPKKDGSPRKGWKNHPCVIMWTPYVAALKQYFNISLNVWINRGFTNNMQPEPIPSGIILPYWLGFSKFHASHRSNLLRKDYDYYYYTHGWEDNPEDPYIWANKHNQYYQQKVGTKIKNYLMEV